MRTQGLSATDKFDADPLWSQSWWSDASCRHADPEWFFPSGPSRRTARRAAVSVCCGCPVLARCLSVALADDDLIGIWAATDERDRARARQYSESRELER